MLPIASCSEEALPIVITRASLVVAGVVSIIDPETRVPPSTAAVPVERVLHLRVFDAEVEDDEWQDRWRGLPDQLFQPHHAEGIISFAKVLEDECATGGTIIVHCGHGQSRSTAATAIVAAAWGHQPMRPSLHRALPKLPPSLGTRPALRYRTVACCVLAPRPSMATLVSSPLPSQRASASNRRG